MLDPNISERLKERERVLGEAMEFAKCVKGKLGKVTVVLYGSYARGDFNEWSDIDVLVIAEQLPENPIERLSLVEDCMARVAGVEPLLLTPDMIQRMRGKNLAVREALERGCSSSRRLKSYKNTLATLYLAAT